MTINTYASLQTAIQVWRDRVADTSITTNAADFIALGEARLTRELPLRVMWTNATLTGTPSSRTLALDATFAEPKWLKRTDTDPYSPLTKQTAERMVYFSSNGTPTEWAINGANIDLNRPCSSALGFQFRYRAKFALSDLAPTNWLLTNHPDIYLAAVLVTSGLLIEADDVGQWNALLSNGIMMLKQLDAKADGDVDLEVDPALLRNGGGRWDFTTDSWL